MNTVVENLTTEELVSVAQAMGTVHYSQTKEKFMSTATEATTTESKPSRREFATNLINAHRAAHRVHPTERLTPEHYDQLGAVLAEAHGLEPTKAVSYLKNLDASMRAPGKKSDVSTADIPGIAGQRVPGSDETVAEAIARMRTEESASKEEIVKAVYDTFETQVQSGVLSIAIINAVVSYVFKQMKSSKSSRSNSGGVPLNDLVLEKYQELCGKYGAESVDDRNRLTGAAADEFNSWYETTRGGKVGAVERTGERMAEHAQWHLNRLLKQKGILKAYTRPAKTEAAPAAEGEAKPRKKANKKSEQTSE